MLVQVWSDEDRTPPWEGELELVDAETESAVAAAIRRHGARLLHARLRRICRQLAAARAAQRRPVCRSSRRHADRGHHLRFSGALASDCLNVLPQSLARAVPGAGRRQSPPPRCCSICWGAHGASRWSRLCGSGWRRSSRRGRAARKKIQQPLSLILQLVEHAAVAAGDRAVTAGAHRSPLRAITC